MLYRGLRDHVRRQIEGNVTDEMVATPVKRAMQCAMMYDAVRWVGVLFHSC